MATITDGSYQTKRGTALVAKLLASKGKLNFTRATIGSGTIPDDTAPEDMTDLVQYVMDGRIAAIENPQNGEALVSVQVMSAGAGFYSTELLQWADDPEDGEIPYTYLSIAQKPEWIRPGTDAVQKLATFNLIAIVSSVALVSTTINPDAFARASDLAALRIDVNRLYKLHKLIPLDAGDYGDAFFYLMPIDGGSFLTDFGTSLVIDGDRLPYRIHRVRKSTPTAGMRNTSAILKAHPQASPLDSSWTAEHFKEDR